MPETVYFYDRIAPVSIAFLVVVELEQSLAW